MAADPIDSRQLRTFYIVARTRSFTLAARELKLTQSAVSHAIRALEADVGCRLLDRIGKKTTLTQAGEHLLRHAECILENMSSARAELVQMGRWGKTRLRLGTTTSACQYLLPLILREFKESFPDCTISIYPGDTTQAIERLRAQQIDLALVLEPRREPQLEFKELFVDELCFLLSPMHAWSQQGRVNEQEITRQNYILYEKNSYTYDLITKYFARRNEVLFTSMELGTMEGIKELVKLDLGVGIVAPWIAEKELRERTLMTLPLGRKKLRRRWGILFWKERRLSLTEETFIGLCAAVTERFDAKHSALTQPSEENATAPSSVPPDRG